jgi:hypothetical protein
MKTYSLKSTYHLHSTWKEVVLKVSIDDVWFSNVNWRSASSCTAVTGMKMAVLAFSTREAIKPMKYHDHLRYVFGAGPTLKSATNLFSRVEFEEQLSQRIWFLSAPRWSSSNRASRLFQKCVKLSQMRVVLQSSLWNTSCAFDRGIDIFHGNLNRHFVEMKHVKYYHCRGWNGCTLTVNFGEIDRWPPPIWHFGFNMPYLPYLNVAFASKWEVCQFSSLTIDQHTWDW